MATVPSFPAVDSSFDFQHLVLSSDQCIPHVHRYRTPGNSLQCYTPKTQFLGQSVLYVSASKRPNWGIPPYFGTLSVRYWTTGSTVWFIRPFYGIQPQNRRIIGRLADNMGLITVNLIMSATHHWIEGYITNRADSNERTFPKDSAGNFNIPLNPSFEGYDLRPPKAFSSVW